MNKIFKILIFYIFITNVLLSSKIENQNSNLILNKDIAKDSLKESKIN